MKIVLKIEEKTSKKTGKEFKSRAIVFCPAPDAEVLVTYDEITICSALDISPARLRKMPDGVYDVSKF